MQSFSSVYRVIYKFDHIVQKKTCSLFFKPNPIAYTLSETLKTTTYTYVGGDNIFTYKSLLYEFQKVLKSRKNI